MQKDDVARPNVRWASEADMVQHERDIALYGTAYSITDPSGLTRRIDPKSVQITPHLTENHDDQ